MGRPVNGDRRDDQISDQVEPARHYMLFVDDAAGPVHVELRTPEMTDWYEDAGSDGLPLPGAAIVSETAHRQEQQRRNHDVIETQQASEQRDGGIEHVLGASNSVLAKEECAEKVDRVERLHDQQSNRLPGKN